MPAASIRAVLLAWALCLPAAIAQTDEEEIRYSVGAYPPSGPPPAPPPKWSIGGVAMIALSPPTRIVTGGLLGGRC